MTATLQKKLFFLFPLILIFLCLIFPVPCREGMKQGTEVILSGALPSLFPFMILSRMLSSAIPCGAGKSILFLPYFLGTVCGFPVGAISIQSLYEKKLISHKDASRLLFCCNGAGAGFLFSFCSAVFSSPKIGLFLFLLQFSLSFPVFLTIFIQSEKSNSRKEDLEENFSFTSLLVSSVSGAISSFLFLCGAILFFSFTQNILLSLIPTTPIQNSIFRLGMEITGGIATLKSLPLSHAIPLCAAACGWAGLSVHIQILSALKKSDLSTSYYFAGKCFYCLVMGILAYFLFPLFF